MSRDNRNGNTVPYNLASLIRGLYGRVARQLKVDPSYVSRVARGERRSDDIEASLERELKRIMALVKNRIMTATAAMATGAMGTSAQPSR